MNKITRNDVESVVNSVMNMDILVAFFESKDGSKFKAINFNPAKPLYRVRFYDDDGFTSNSYDEVFEAIEKYNSYEL